MILSRYYNYQKIIIIVMSIVQVLFPFSDKTKYLRTLLLPTKDDIKFYILLEKKTYKEYKGIVKREHTNILVYNKPDEIPEKIREIAPIGVIYTIKPREKKNIKVELPGNPMIYYIHHGFANNITLYQGNKKWKKDMVYVFGDPVMYNLVKSYHKSEEFIIKIPGLPQFDYLMNLPKKKISDNFSILVVTSQRDMRADDKEKSLNSIFSVISMVFGEQPVNLYIKHKVITYHFRYAKNLKSMHKKYPSIRSKTILNEMIYEYLDADMIFVVDYSTVIYEAFIRNPNLIIHQISDPLRKKQHKINAKYGLLVAKNHKNLVRYIRMIKDKDPYLDSDGYREGIKNFLRDKIGSDPDRVSDKILESIQDRYNRTKEE